MLVFSLEAVSHLLELRMVHFRGLAFLSLSPPPLNTARMTLVHYIINTFGF